MMRFFVGQLPAWARRDHPALRHELGIKPPPLPTPVRYIRAFLHLLALWVLLLIGFLTATNFLQRIPNFAPAEMVFNLLYVPTLIIQVVLGASALANTAGFVTEQMARGTWDNLRATQDGVEMAMRARWMAIFYRMRRLLILVTGIRVILIGMMLWELMAFQGHYLDLLVNGITPDVILPVAVILLSFAMTAALLLPITSIGMDASVGLLVSVLVRGRTAGSMAQALLLFLRIGGMLLLLMAGTQYIRGELLDVTDLGAWLLLGAGGSFAEWGVGFLHLGRFGEIWATVPYGILLGGGLLVFSLLQALVADFVLVLAARRGQESG